MRAWSTTGDVLLAGVGICRGKSAVPIDNRVECTAGIDDPDRQTQMSGR